MFGPAWSVGVPSEPSSARIFGGGARGYAACSGTEGGPSPSGVVSAVAVPGVVAVAVVSEVAEPGEMRSVGLGIASAAGGSGSVMDGGGDCWDVPDDDRCCSRPMAGRPDAS